MPRLQSGGKVTYNVIKTRLGDLLYKLRCVCHSSSVNGVACLMAQPAPVRDLLCCPTRLPACSSQKFEDPAEGEEALKAKFKALNEEIRERFRNLEEEYR